MSSSSARSSHKRPTSVSSSRSVRSRRSPSFVNQRPTPVYATSQTSTRPQSSNRESTPTQHEGLDTDDTLYEVIMAVDVKSRGTVGCAYYIAQGEKLHVMEDVKLGGADVVEALKLFIDATVIVIPFRLDDAIVDKLDPEHRTQGSTDGRSETFNLPYRLEPRPASEFAYESAKNKLANLNIGSAEGPKLTFVVPGDVTIGEDLDIEDDVPSGREGQLLRMAGWMDIESSVTMGCVGALLSYIQRRRATAYLPGDQDSHTMFRISTIQMFSLNDTMFVNADTLLSLQIIQSESHPHSHNQGPTKSTSGSKEGLSVYGLFHHLARTPQGKLLLRQYFLRPSLSIDVIKARQNTIGVMIRPDNAATMKTVVDNLSRIKNMRPVMVNLRKGISGGKSKMGKRGGFVSTIWSSIRFFVFHTLKIKDALQELVGAERLTIYQKVMQRFEGHQLGTIGRSISEVVDFEQSAEHHRVVVQMGIDEELDNMKRTYDSLESLLSRVAAHVSKSVPAALDTQLNVLFFPQIGFLIANRLDPRTGSGIYEGSEEDPWEKIFVTDDFAYYKNSNVAEMDSYLGDVYGQICDKEIEILHALAEKILEFEDLLTVISDICGELDALLALAQGAQMYNLTRPNIATENIIKVKGGRHPLQELTVPAYVPNDACFFGGHAADVQRDRSGSFSSSVSSVLGLSAAERPNMVLVTGPNYSGKSVYLKQVALITFMAHIGSFVPAESATIGITDKILTRIATRESVSRIQSAFMIDLQQISLALNLATPRSLLVIDEFGKGTESYDGAGLAAGVFEHLLNRGSECPKVLAATHFHEIFESGFLPPRDSLAFGHMEVRVDHEAATVENQITYLYNYRQGRSTSSFGTCCAAMNGVAPEIIRRAEELILLSARGEDMVAACAIVSEEETEELVEAERVARGFLAVDVDVDAREALGRILFG